MDFLIDILSDGFFAAIAAIGFASISNPPRQAYAYCGLIAAVGHALRYVLMHHPWGAMHIVPASMLASFSIGCLAVLLARSARCPAESFSFPALLPMIPGMYAYRTFAALMLCLGQTEEEGFAHCAYLCATNGLTCAFILLGLVLGATIPIFVFKNLSFHATR